MHDSKRVCKGLWKISRHWISLEVFDATLSFANTLFKYLCTSIPLTILISHYISFYLSHFLIDNTAHTFLYGYYQGYVNTWPYEWESLYKCYDYNAHSKSNGFCYAAKGGKVSHELWISVKDGSAKKTPRRKYQKCFCDITSIDWIIFVTLYILWDLIIWEL